MTTASPGPGHDGMDSWFIIKPEYAIDACVEGCGWVDVNYIRMWGGSLQCHTGFGTLTLTLTDYDLIKVVYLKQFDLAAKDISLDNK